MPRLCIHSSLSSLNVSVWPNTSVRPPARSRSSVPVDRVSSRRSKKNRFICRSPLPLVMVILPAVPDPRSGAQDLLPSVVPTVASTLSSLS